jgi:hypothetical protein
MLFFRLSSWTLVWGVFAVLVGASALGLVIGRRIRHRDPQLREPVGVVQAALLGFMGLVLAFGLSLAVGRYEGRRAALVEETNAIGTTYLRAQTLAEPMRSQSLDRLVRYTDSRIRLSRAVPTSPGAARAEEEGAELERQLWRLGGRALEGAPDASAPRLYVESLNNMFDMGTARVAALNNRVPDPVLGLEVLGAGLALGLLGLNLGLLGRGFLPVLVASALVSLMMLVIFDLDRPARGLIEVPATALNGLRTSMELAPAADGPSP